jgi:hypothetical protein
MGRDWTQEVPYSECLTESDVVDRAFEAYIDLSTADLNVLESHWTRIKNIALQKHLQHERTPWELYADGMPYPEYQIWEAYRRARLLSGVCRVVQDIKALRHTLKVDDIAESEDFLRRSAYGLQVAQELPDSKRSIGTVCQEVAALESVTPDTVRRMFNRKMKGGRYKTLDDLIPLLKIGDRIRRLKGIELDLHMSKVRGQ